MSIPISTVPAVRSYLISAITAQVNAAGLSEPGCEVYDSAPDHETTNDVIAVCGARRQTRPLALVGSGGQFWLDESYQVEVMIDCFQAGADGAMEAVNARAYQLLALVETAVRQDPSLAGNVLEARPQESESTPSWDDAHMGARCVIATQIQVYTTL
jgi:hypothetical protein